MGSRVRGPVEHDCLWPCADPADSGQGEGRVHYHTGWHQGGAEHPGKAVGVAPGRRGRAEADVPGYPIGKTCLARGGGKVCPGRGQSLVLVCDG